MSSRSRCCLCLVHGWSRRLDCSSCCRSGCLLAGSCRSITGSTCPWLLRLPWCQRASLALVIIAVAASVEGSALPVLFLAHTTPPPVVRRPEETEAVLARAVREDEGLPLLFCVGARCAGRRSLGRWRRHLDRRSSLLSTSSRRQRPAPLLQGLHLLLQMLQLAVADDDLWARRWSLRVRSLRCGGSR